MSIAYKGNHRVNYRQLRGIGKSSRKSYYLNIKWEIYGIKS